MRIADLHDCLANQRCLSLGCTWTHPRFVSHLWQNMSHNAGYVSPMSRYAVLCRAMAHYGRLWLAMMRFLPMLGMSIEPEI